MQNEPAAITIDDVAQFRSCLTCVFRRPYPASMKTSQPVFYRFQCQRAFDSNKGMVRPEDVCPHWAGATLRCDA